MLLIIPFADICGNFDHQRFNTPSINFNGFYFNKEEDRNTNTGRQNITHKFKN
jgi:hypothetical protein